MELRSGLVKGGGWVLPHSTTTPLSPEEDGEVAVGNDAYGTDMQDENDSIWSGPSWWSWGPPISESLGVVKAEESATSEPFITSPSPTEDEELTVGSYAGDGDMTDQDDSIWSGPSWWSWGLPSVESSHCRWVWHTPEVPRSDYDGALPQYG